MLVQPLALIAAFSIHPSPDTALLRNAPPLLRVQMTAAVNQLLSEHMFSIVKSAADERVQVVRITSENCCACKTMESKYEKMSKDWPEADFHDLPFDNNKELCKTMGVKLLPFMMVHRGNGEVDSFVCAASKLHLLEEKLEALVVPSRNGLRGWRQRWRRTRWRRAKSRKP